MGSADEAMATKAGQELLIAPDYPLLTMVKSVGPSSRWNGLTVPATRWCQVDNIKILV